MAVFSGPDAQERAEEYARLKYRKALARLIHGNREIERRV
jgi:hypothetical protein